MDMEKRLEEINHYYDQFKSQIDKIQTMFHQDENKINRIKSEQEEFKTEMKQ